MNFYPFNDIDTISPRPMLFITGDHFTELARVCLVTGDEEHRTGRDCVDIIERVKIHKLRVCRECRVRCKIRSGAPGRKFATRGTVPSDALHHR
jgi:hypothetical protein